MSALPEDAKSAARKLVDSRLTTLYERYHAEVYLYCRSRLRDPDEAMDIVQEAALRAWRYRRSRTGAFRPWFLAISID